MLQYLVILLAEDSVSFCHYENRNTGNLLSINALKDGLRFSMLENLSVQYVFPEGELPNEYLTVIEQVENVKIMPTNSPYVEKANVLIFNGLSNLKSAKSGVPYVVRCNKDEFFTNYEKLIPLLEVTPHLSVVFKDLVKFNENDFEQYKTVLETFSKHVEELYVDGKSPQFNLLTDRMYLDKMRNCEAGVKTITLAPDGNFYICPAFYYNGEMPCGNPNDGLDIKNPQLYKLEYAPICRRCDAFHCRRCVWLNKLTTLEVNTPSHEQCVVSHIERNAAKSLLAAIRKHGEFMPQLPEIAGIDYFDPFDKIEK